MGRTSHGEVDEDRQRYSPDQRKRLILEASRRVLVDNPDATLEEIAVEAGVTRQLISRYFPGGGITPIAEALFDEYEHHFAHIFVDVPKDGVESHEELVEVIDKTVGHFLDWAEEDGQPWLFGGEGAAIASHLAARRADLRTNLAMVMLHFARKIVPENDLTRIALQAEGRASDEIVWQLLTGRATREQCELVIKTRFLAITEIVLPSLGGQSKAS